MPSSPEEMCSAALVLIGATGISAFTEGNKGATCETLYPIVLDGLLGEYPWRFLIQKRQLSQLAVAPENEWTYAYQLPSDIEGAPLGAFSTSDVGADPVKEWELFGRQIFTDYTSLWIDYKVKVSEPDMPGYFQSLLIYDLAWHLAIPITRDEKKADYWQRRVFPHGHAARRTGLAVAGLPVGRLRPDLRASGMTDGAYPSPADELYVRRA